MKTSLGFLRLKAERILGKLFRNVLSNGRLC